ncbi:hypothetical protein HK099_001399 [Clydaea vesicula]|uniref:Ras GEF n=1 Tax=Clydaea vesicula TaxID=447962 RepID=A0AAD5XZQ0_9FUNG|nr:hypothetical protein HK099_001399 [Clydaea vesicula]
MHSYSTSEKSCLSFQKGDRIKVYQKDVSGWWDGSIGEKRGWFPSNYVEKVLVSQQQQQLPTLPSTTSNSSHQPVNKDKDNLKIQTSKSISENKLESISFSLNQLISENLTSTPPISSNYKNNKKFFGEDTNSEYLELPKFWGKKVTSQGQIYYYNSSSNQTTFSLDEVLSTTVAGEEEFKKEKSLQPKKGMRSRSASNNINWIPGTKSLLIENEKVSWEILINNILKAIGNLNQSAKNDAKAEYITQSNEIIISIRDMLVSSGCSDRNSPILNSNKVLRSHHHHIMTSLSKLVLTSKVASGIWPPPDAVNKMRYQAGQVLLSIRHFVSIAQDVPLVLTPVSECKLDDFDIKGAELSDIEFVGRLDSYIESIATCIYELVEVVNVLRNGSTASLHTSMNHQNLIEKARTAVTEIGQFLSLIEEIKYTNLLLNQNLNDPILKEFIFKKELLYSTVNDLVTSARSTLDQFAPENSLEILLSVTNSASKAVEELGMATKLIIDQEDLIEQIVLAREAEEIERENGVLSKSNSVKNESELGLLQRRALSLNFLKDDSLKIGGKLSSDDLASPSTSNFSALYLNSNAGLNNNKEINRITAPAVINNSVMDKENVLVGEFNDHWMNGRHEQTFSKATSMPPLANSTQNNNNIYKRADSEGKLSKLEKLIGKEVRGEMLKKPVEPQAWYLNYDYLPNTISFNMEGQVNGGKFSSLVERLTLHDQIVVYQKDNGFMIAFLMMFKQFTTTDELIDELLSRFFIEPPPNLAPEDLQIWKEKKQTPIRLRVYNTLKTWLENYWTETDLQPLEKLQYIAKTKMLPILPNITPRLLDILQKKLSHLQQHTNFSTQASFGISKKYPEWGTSNSQTNLLPNIHSQAFSFQQQAPNPVLPRNYLNILKNNLNQPSIIIMEFDPLEIARQLTLIENRIFLEINSSELMAQEWTKKNSLISVNVRKSTKMSTLITGWVAQIILGENDVKKRATLLKHIIKIGDRSLALNNFSTLMSIVSALNSSTISRLKRTWDLTSTKTKQTFESLKKATDLSRNYAVYRQTIKDCQPPCLPFLGLYLTDLTFTEDGNPDFRGKNLINFDKYYKASKIILDLMRFQTPYNLQPVKELQDYLINSIENSNNPKDLYRVSLLLEPRLDGGFVPPSAVQN